jgi:hypothetical protein
VIVEMPIDVPGCDELEIFSYRVYLPGILGHGKIASYIIDVYQDKFHGHRLLNCNQHLESINNMTAMLPESKMRM